ncbi:MAG: molybdopterin-synthase adenylyltransferase MoeB [Candidatus Sumerlaea chitinivorans]|nr:molybdopterin-synthase adenylyltransferase MoeB [Candidatus Sumerlaea chitinivorans]
MGLTAQQRERYLRHLLLPQIGEQGQEKLLASKVLIIGVGGLGSPAALYLAAAGVGTLGLVDSDVVEESNLQRQVLHSTRTVGKSKLESARERITELNPDVQVRTYETRLTSQNALEILADYDVVVDGSDNFPTRYLSNDACVLLKKPNVYGALFRFEGQASVFDATRGPCYRCLFPEPPPPGAVPSCAEAGVLGVLPGLIGVVQATETIKLLLGIGTPLVGRLLLYDALAMSFRTIALKRNRDCPVCGEKPTIRKLIDYEHFCSGGHATMTGIEEITVDELAERLREGGDFVLVDCRNPEEHAQARIDGAMLIPLGTLPERLSELESYRDKTVIVHCAKGGRSARACQILKQAGFARPINVRGGISEWIARGYPVER